MYLRVSKAALVAMVAFFAALVTINNIVDYGSNFEFVQHVMMMDTTFEGNALMGRAIAIPELHHLFYWGIIAAEGAVALLCAFGAIKMFQALKLSQSEFNQAKFLATVGLVLGVCLWFTGFMTVGGEWFLMWQSDIWNGQSAAFKFIVILMAVLMFLHQAEPQTQDA